MLNQGKLQNVVVNDEGEFMKGLFSSHIHLVGKVLDMQLQRQNVINSNLANVNTPKYKPRELEFEEELQKALGLDLKGNVARTSEGHMPSTFSANNFHPEFFKKFTPREVHGEDRVNLDKEMGKLAKNQLHYMALTQVIQKNFEGIKTIIQEGKQ